MIVVRFAFRSHRIIILRRPGVYFSLLTLALAALAYTTAFRWTACDRRGTASRPQRGQCRIVRLDNALNYYIVAAFLSLGVLYLCCGWSLAVRPWLVAIRDNQLRATSGLSGRTLQLGSSSSPPW